MHVDCHLWGHRIHRHWTYGSPPETAGDTRRKYLGPIESASASLETPRHRPGEFAQPEDPETHA
jgi:hypothetical protein